MKFAVPLFLLALSACSVLLQSITAAPADSAEPSKLKKEAPFCENCKARPPSYLVGKRGPREEVLFPVWNLEQQQQQQAPLSPAMAVRMLRELMRGRISLLRAGGGAEDEYLYGNINKEEVKKESPFCDNCHARRLDFPGKRSGGASWMLAPSSGGGQLGEFDSE
ncbi:hypothetical protein TYRP_004046 [Tyrophagus putrescentiae]|nr:hypothetical protein TYRP_004046 [Tyrophagus putrescentiae]